MFVVDVEQLGLDRPEKRVVPCPRDVAVQVTSPQRRSESGMHDGCRVVTKRIRHALGENAFRAIVVRRHNPGRNTERRVRFVDLLNDRLNLAQLPPVLAHHLCDAIR